jgi:hypothetical protein
VFNLAQDWLAKKCGIIEEDESLVSMTLQQYLDIYKQPLTDESLEAIHKLTEVSVAKKKKKSKISQGKKMKKSIEQK